MLVQQRYCGYCEEPLLMDTDTCINSWCESNDEPFITTHRPLNYSATALMEAQAFLDAHPEFRKDQGLNKHRKIGAYDSVEDTEFTTPTDLTSDDLPYERDSITDQYSREAEWDGIYGNRDNYQKPSDLTYWRDVEPKRCTHAIYWYSNKPSAPAYPMPYKDHHMPTKVWGSLNNGQPYTMTEKSSYELAYEALDFSDKNLVRFSFTELQGFAQETLIDYGITERYQYTLFNIYVGRDSNLHCGLLTIASDAVTCSKPNCYYKHNALPIPKEPTRKEMEHFVSALIRHGNNHGPDWYLKRKDFSFIHATECDTNHHRHEFCNTNSPKDYLDLLDLSDVIEFLIRHRKFCRDSNCRCGAYYHTLSHYERESVAA